MFLPPRQGSWQGSNQDRKVRIERLQALITTQLFSQLIKTGPKPELCQRLWLGSLAFCIITFLTQIHSPPAWSETL